MSMTQLTPSLFRSQAITSFVEMKDNSTEFVRVRYYSSCLSGGPPEETNRCDGLRIGQQVNFTAKIEVRVTAEVVEVEVRAAVYQTVSKSVMIFI